MPGSRDDRNAPQNGPSRLPAADLLIDRVRVQNFRSLANVDVRLEKTTTFLVGENNAGKSSLLLAIDSACGGHRATTDDLFKDENGRRAEEAIIDIIFRSKNSVFNERTATPLLSRHIFEVSGQCEWSAFRTKLRASAEGSFLTISRIMLQWYQEDWIEPEIPTIVDRRLLPRLFKTSYIRESRDLSEDLSRKTSDWNRVLSNLDIKEKERAALEEKLENLVNIINSESPIIEKVTNNLNQLSKYQSDIDSVNLETIPTSIDELARSINITITNNSRKLPLRYQGLGSRGVASLLVYISLLDIIGLDQGIRPHIITLLEEPEAHLHPQAQASVRRLLKEVPEQTVVSTHSSILIGEISDPSSIRLLRSSKEGTKIHTISKDKPKSIATFRRYVERPLGEIFFARLVVFVDGTAERITLPVLLEPELGSDPSGRGITFVAMDGMHKVQLEKAVNALKDLGDIPWLVFVDNDDAGWKAIEGIMGRDSKELSEDHCQVIFSGSKQLEQMLLDAQYDSEIQDVANKQYPDGSPDNSTFLKGNKGWAGELIAKEAVKNQREMPEPIRKLAQAIKHKLENEGK